MTRQKLPFAVVAAFVVSLAPAWAQDRPNQDTGPSRPSSGDVVGRAAERSDPAPAPATPTASSSGSSSSSSSSSGSSRSGSPSWDGPSRSYESPRSDAPQRSSQRAVPRGSSGSDSSGSRSGGTATTRSASAGSDSDDRRGRDRTPVPAYSRPRDGRTPVGTAADRRTPLLGRGGIDVLYYPSSLYYYDPYYFRYRPYASYWLPGYGYGLGYFGYDPFFWGSYGYYSGYYGGGYSGYAYPSQRYDTGSLRLKVRPTHAQVYVDGYFVGVVDSFDGVFQRLAVEAGSHRIEIRAEGYEPVQFEVMVTPGETITYKGEMIRRQP